MRFESIAAHAGYTPEPAPDTAAAPIGQRREDGPQLRQPVARGKTSAVAAEGGVGQPSRLDRA